MLRRLYKWLEVVVNDEMSDDEKREPDVAENRRDHEIEERDGGKGAGVSTCIPQESEFFRTID